MAPMAVSDVKLEEGGFDAVISTLGLHWTNNLLGALMQVKLLLKSDALMLISFLGESTGVELRQALQAAELERDGGMSPRVAPAISVRDAAALLQHSGFHLPAADIDTVTVHYTDLPALSRHLRTLGEGNAITQRRAGPLRRDTALAAAATYSALVADSAARNSLPL